MDKGNRLSSVEEAEVLFSKAANAEFKGNYDVAISHYLQAGQMFLNLMKRADEEHAKGVCRKGVEKCMKRAEEIRAVKKDLKPVVVNPFDEGEQFRVLENSSKVNGVRFSAWKGYTEFSDAQAIDSQPDLGQSIIAKSPIWKRPQELFDKINIASPHLKPDDVFQNSITDCSVCSSLSVCLRHQQMFGSKLGLSCLFPQGPDGIPKISSTGRYSLRAFMNGVYREIDMDDYLPFYSDGRPIAVSTAGCSDLWPSLVEKGYMKLMGGYDFPGSNSSVDINVLTNWIPEHIEIRSPSFESERAWTRILHNFLSGRCVLTVGTGERPAHRLQIGDIQLLPTHSYAVIDVSEDGDERWFTILNPWNGSVEDEELQASLGRMQLQSNKSTAIKISWEGIYTIFDGVYLNWDPALFSHQIQFHGSWKSRSEKSSAQSTHYPLRFAIKPTKQEEVWVLLIRHFVDRNRKKEYIAMNVQPEDVKELTFSRPSALRGTYTSSTHILARYTVEDSSSQLTAIASYDGEYEEVSFTVQVFATSPIEWITEPRIPMIPKTIKGRFFSTNCGGNCTFPTFMNNPQYRLRILPKSVNASRPVSSVSTSKSRLGKVNVRISVESLRSIPLNVMAIWSKGERVDELPEGNIAASSGAYSYGIAQMSALLSPDDYSIVVSTFDTSHRGSFTLQLECSSDYEIDSIPDEGQGMFDNIVKGAWGHGKDGGGPQFRRYMANPMFDVDVKATTTMKIRLQSIPSTSLNVALFEAQQSPSGPHTRSLGKPVATSGPHREGVCGVATRTFTVRPGNYLLVPSTFDPGIHASFTVVVYSGNKITLKEV